jgi:DNA-binding transcriptional regulator GbsR (MarR family)
MLIDLPKGNAEVTDQILRSRIETFERPITINELVLRLNWSRGKIDGSLNRLQEKKEVATVKVSLPKGQRRRYIGLPQKTYWKQFYQQIIVQEKNILINDPLGVFKDAAPQINPLQSSLVEELQKTVDNLYRTLKDRELQIEFLKKQALDISSDIDPSIIQVLKEQQDLITTAAKQRGITSAELLKSSIPQIADPNFDLITKIVTVVINESRSEVDSIERTVARTFLRRAQTLERR